MSSKSGMHKYRYRSSDQNWYELPIDLSASDFCAMVNNSGKLQTKLTREQIQRAVNHIHYDKENEKKDKRDKVGNDAKNYIYRDIYLRHLENRSYKDYVNIDLEPSKRKHTNPSHFYWEARDLLTALAIAFSKDTLLKNEDLAQQTLKELGKLLGEKSPDDVESDVITQKLLLDGCVQENMVMSFEKDLETRLRAIWNLSHQIPSSAMGKAMMDTLRKLDVILLELVDLRDQKTEQNALPQSSEGIPDQQTTPYEKFEQLYRGALQPRNMMRQRNTASKADISYEERLLFALPAGEENKIIIEKIGELLETYNRANKRNVEAQFEDLYRLYLTSKENRPELAEEALSFLEDYQKLEQYAHGESSAAEFAVQFRQELYSFARDIFASTNRSYMDFRHILDHTFLCANDAFAYGRLDAVHQAIWKEINIPIWLIRIQKVFLVILRTEIRAMTPLSSLCHFSISGTGSPYLGIQFFL